MIVMEAVVVRSDLSKKASRSGRRRSIGKNL
jgi:hypothetical protein